MTTDTLAQALTALNQADPNHPAGLHRHAAILYRQTVGSSLAEAVQAVAAAVESHVEINRYLTDSGNRPSYWLYEFPNGHTASVIIDYRPQHAFRFEVESTDPADASNGGVAAGLTTEQVEAKLRYLHGLPTRNDD